jgi:hypothetical protein
MVFAITLDAECRTEGVRPLAWLLAWLLIAASAGGAAAAAPAIAVRTGEHADHSRIVFDWTSAVGVTVETPSAEELVVVFDRPAQFDLAKANARRLSRVAAIEPLAGRSAVRIRLRGAHGHRQLNVGFKIVVDIIDGRAATADQNAITKKTSQPKRQDQADYSETANAASVPVEAASPGRPAEAPDDASLLVPSSAMGAAAGRPGVPAQAPATQPARESAGPAEPEEPIPDPLLDPAAWRGTDSFLTGRSRLAERAAADPEDAAALLDLARYLFAWRHADEALSVLAAVARHDPQLARRIDVRALADAARLLRGTAGGAAGVFAQPRLRERPEAQLWQGVAAALAGDFAGALRAFEAGERALSGYPPAFRAFFGLHGLQAAVETGAFGPARAYEAVVADGGPTTDEAAMLAALSGVRLARQQQYEAARSQLTAAARGPALKPQIIARLALIELERAAGKLRGAAVTAALEQLYYSWEGDALQLRILDALVRQYIAEKRHDDAFDAVALAQRQFPADPLTDKMTSTARDLFRKLLIPAGTGAGEALDPLSALALYDEHRELMPHGPAAAAILRGLGDRLAALDLMEPATRLYEEALRALPPEQQAEIRAKLADLPHAAGGDDATLPAAASGAEADPLERAGEDWRNGEWLAAGLAYLQAAQHHDGPGRTGLILRATAAFMLAGRNDEVAAIRKQYGSEMAASPAAAVFAQLTAPDAGIEVLSLPEVSAAVVRLDQGGGR